MSGKNKSLKWDELSPDDKMKYEIAEELGLEYTSVSASTAWWLLPTYYVRELYGILYQWFL